MLGKARVEAPDLYKLASPITHVDANDPPFLILHGVHDPLVPFRQSLLLYKALDDAGNDVILLGIERAGHGFFMNSRLDYLDPGVITVYTSGSATSFDRGKNLADVPFGFDLVESFFRQQLVADTR